MGCSRVRFLMTANVPTRSCFPENLWGPSLSLPPWLHACYICSVRKWIREDTRRSRRIKWRCRGCKRVGDFWMSKFSSLGTRFEVFQNFLWRIVARDGVSSPNLTCVGVSQPSAVALLQWGQKLKGVSPGLRSPGWGVQRMALRSGREVTRLPIHISDLSRLPLNDLVFWPVTVWNANKAGGKIRISWCGLEAVWAHPVQVTKVF